MKLTKSTYFSFFFLFCFLASFSATTYKNIYSIANKIEVKNSKTVFVSSKQESGNSIPDFLYEETEDENENGFYAHLIAIPFFIAFFQLEFTHTKLLSAKPLAEKITNPIYISVCNFRL
jgi:hypothetical protein